MSRRPIQIFVEEHDALPEGCSMVFEAVGPGRPVKRIRYEGAIWEIAALSSSGESTPATAVPVSDSGAGTSLLLFGGDRGLRLGAPDGTMSAEPYLLLDEDAIEE